MDDAELEHLYSVARGDVPAEYATLIGVSVAPWGTHALVLLALNESPHIEFEQVVCSRTPSGEWQELMSGGPGLSDVLMFDDVRVRPIGDAEELPSDATSVVVSDGSEEQEVAVTDGYFLYASWKRDSAGEEGTDPPKPKLVRILRPSDGR